MMLADLRWRWQVYGARFVLRELWCRLNEVWKWPIARLLNRRPDTCWAMLVMWAMGYRSLSDGWRQECAPGDPYCGKCAPRSR